MCSILKSCTFNGLSTNGELSCKSPLSNEPASCSNGFNSCTTSTIHSHDTTSTLDAQLTEDGGTTTKTTMSNTPWNDGLNLEPEDVSSRIFALCFAVEMTFLIKKYLSEDCPGCYMTAVSDSGHTCDLESWEHAVKRYYKKAESYMDTYKLRMRLRTFKMKPEIYEKYQIPNDYKFDEMMMRCKYFWIDYIYDMILEGFPYHCPYAVKHAFRF